MAKETAFDMRKFDMSQVGTNKNLMFIGKKGTGKTCLVLDYLYHNRDILTTTVISPTDNFTMIYKPHISENFIHDEYTPELVKSFLKKQQNKMKQQFMDRPESQQPNRTESQQSNSESQQSNSESQQPNSEYKEDPRSILVLDDCMFDNNVWMTDHSLKWIFMNGRIDKITMIVTAPYAHAIRPEMRVNTDYIFMCKEPMLYMRKKLYEHYGGIFPNFEMFERVLMDTTDNYGCLVIDNNPISDKLEDQVFWYKAEIHGQFRMGEKL